MLGFGIPEVLPAVVRTNLPFCTSDDMGSPSYILVASLH